MSFEVLILIFAIIVWVISSIVKGVKWLKAQIEAINARPSLMQEAVAEAQRQAAPRERSSSPMEPAASRPVRTLPPAPRYKTGTAEFFSQEQTLLAEEVSGLGVPLTPPPTPRPTQPAPLFGNVDDLVRAIILQEALGPPLSKRQSSSTRPPV